MVLEGLQKSLWSLRDETVRVGRAKRQDPFHNRLHVHSVNQQRQDSDFHFSYLLPFNQASVSHFFFRRKKRRFSSLM